MCDMHQQQHDKFLVCAKNVLGNKALYSDSDSKVAYNYTGFVQYLNKYVILHH